MIMKILMGISEVLACRKRMLIIGSSRELESAGHLLKPVLPYGLD